jgi:hypothetical protein
MRKAQYAADTAPFYIVFGIVITFLFLAFMWLLAYYTTNISKIPEGVEYSLITERFYSSDCFGLTTSELDIPQRNIIDWYKFHQNNLDGCYSTTSSDQPQFKLKLKVEIPPRETDELTTKHWVDELSFDKKETRTVLVYHEDKVKEGQLSITTQWEKARFK